MHPRSRMTASLFTTTLMVSFLVVAAPHLIPCPVDPRTLNDSADPTRRRRRRKPVESDSQEGESREGEDGALEQQRRMMLEERMNPKRECPIPKPGGLVGQVFGMTRRDGNEGQGEIIRQVEQIRRTRSGDDQ